MKKKSAHKVAGNKTHQREYFPYWFRVKRALKTRHRMQREADLFTNEEFTNEFIDQESLTKVVSWFDLCGYEITDIYIDGVTDTIDVAGKRFQIRDLKPDVDSLDELKNEHVTVDLVGFWDNADPKPFGTILINSNTTCVVVVLASTSSSWINVRKWNKRWYVFYKCPADEVLFYNLDEKSELKWLNNDDSDQV